MDQPRRCILPTQSRSINMSRGSGGERAGRLFVPCACLPTILTSRLFNEQSLGDVFGFVGADITRAGGLQVVPGINKHAGSWGSSNLEEVFSAGAAMI